MSRPNPIEGIEPSEVFQASHQHRMPVVLSRFGMTDRPVIVYQP